LYKNRVREIRAKYLQAYYDKNILFSDGFIMDNTSLNSIKLPNYIIYLITLKMKIYYTKKLIKK